MLARAMQICIGSDARAQATVWVRTRTWKPIDDHRVKVKPPGISTPEARPRVAPGRCMSRRRKLCMPAAGAEIFDHEGDVAVPLQSYRGRIDHMTRG